MAVEDAKDLVRPGGIGRPESRLGEVGPGEKTGRFEGSKGSNCHSNWSRKPSRLVCSEAEKRSVLDVDEPSSGGGGGGKSWSAGNECGKEYSNC